jgi:hypothetical protein
MIMWFTHDFITGFLALMGDVLHAMLNAWTFLGGSIF